LSHIATVYEDMLSSDELSEDAQPQQILATYDDVDAVVEL